MANNSNLSKRAALRKQQELETRRKRRAKMLGVFRWGAFKEARDAYIAHLNNIYATNLDKISYSKVA